VVNDEEDADTEPMAIALIASAIGGCPNPGIGKRAAAPAPSELREEEEEYMCPPRLGRICTSTSSSLESPAGKLLLLRLLRLTVLLLLPVLLLPCMLRLGFM